MNNILADTEEYVTRLFKHNKNDKLLFHNFAHTKSVVKAAELISGKCNHNGTDINALLVAAWFHDVGYFETNLNHEEISMQAARKFLSERGTNKAFIGQVERIIDATKIPQTPGDLLSAVLCDADLYHLSQDGFIESTRVFWDELVLVEGDIFDEKKYLLITLNFFNDHQFQTEYGRTMLEPGKQSNLKKLKGALKKLKAGKN